VALEPSLDLLVVQASQFLALNVLMDLRSQQAVKKKEQ